MNYRAVRSSNVGKRAGSALGAFGLVMALLVALAVVLPTRAQSPSPPAWAHTGTPSTGVAAVDAAISAVLAGDAHALFDTLSFTDVECQTQPGLGGLRCPDGVANGTPLKAIFTGQCELSGLLESVASPSDVAFAARPGLFLYAVDTAVPSQSFAAAKYLVFFGSGNDPGIAGANVATSDLPIILGVTDAGVTRLLSGCSRGVADTAAHSGVTEWLLAPKNTDGATPTATSTPKVPSVGSGNVDAANRTVPLLFVAGAGLVVTAGGAAIALRRR